jgi:hypothetical protein
MDIERAMQNTRHHPLPERIVRSEIGPLEMGAPHLPARGACSNFELAYLLEMGIAS